MTKPLTKLSEVADIVDYYIRNAIIVQMAYLALEGRPSTVDDARKYVKEMAAVIQIRETV